MSKNQTREQLLDSLKAKGIDLAGRTPDQYLRDESNRRLLNPQKPQPPAVLTKEQAIANAAALDVAREKRLAAQEAQQQQAAEQAEANPFRAIVDSGNVQLSRKQRKHLESLATERDTRNAEQAAAAEARAKAEADPAYQSAIAGSGAFIAAMPTPELRQSALNALETLKQSPGSVADYLTAERQLCDTARAHLSAKLGDALAANRDTTAQVAEIKTLADKIPAAEPVDEPQS